MTDENAAKGRRIRFGGTNLRKEFKEEVWYDHINKDGTRRNMVWVRSGQEVDADRVENVMHYIDNGLAEFVDAAPTK